MKVFYKISAILLIAVLLASCSSTFYAERGEYEDGIYNPIVKDNLYASTSNETWEESDDYVLPMESQQAMSPYGSNLAPSSQIWNNTGFNNYSGYSPYSDAFMYGGYGCTGSSWLGYGSNWYSPWGYYSPWSWQMTMMFGVPYGSYYGSPYYNPMYYGWGYGYGNPWGWNNFGEPNNLHYGPRQNIQLNPIGARNVITSTTSNKPRDYSVETRDAIPNGNTTVRTNKPKPPVTTSQRGKNNWLNDIGNSTIKPSNPNRERGGFLNEIIQGIPAQSTERGGNSFERPGTKAPGTFTPGSGRGGSITPPVNRGSGRP